jgi:type I restriction enzyme M protein
MIGYKRRKNLPDLQKPNHLYLETTEGNVEKIDKVDPKTVLDYFFSDEFIENSEMGFNVTIKDIVSRKSYRMDPKYCWLWYKQRGIIGIKETKKVPISNYLQLVNLKKIAKGSLDEETQIVDLDNSHPRSGKILTYESVDEIGSDRVKFEGAEFVFSKLEPYLGKVIIDPPQDAIGSPEWIGLKRGNEISKTYIGYLLMHPSLCEAYRRLQSGKRHARLDPNEMLELVVPAIDELELPRIDEEINKSISLIQQKEDEINALRENIDSVVM